MLSFRHTIKFTVIIQPDNNINDILRPDDNMKCYYPYDNVFIQPDEDINIIINAVYNTK